jgi:ubiquinone/menaquinone biosynthesis C-methylase UbiE
VQPGFFQATEMPDAEWWEALWPDPAGLVRAVGIADGMDVIDLCSGDGWFTLPIAKIARSATALDIDADLLELSRTRLAEHGVTNCYFLAGDAYDIARLVPRKVDLVFLANVFHGVPDQTKLSRAVRKTLLRGGRFAIVNWHQRSREETTVLGHPRGPRTELRMSPEQTVSAVTAAGLALDKIIELPPHHYAAIFVRE